ncbi:MAG TPA: hypothetical protein PK668_18695 [Myxococcota bacterium]|nr:hypothetical protein [Myxococcota bacterium]HRY96581.1 hypothetical protein [Myxococcota bacterium]HSA20851.1 hypothetical protein [Myxococcota bacterium]
MRRHLLTSMALAASLVAGCGVDLPDGGFGQSVRGELTYRGRGLEGLSRPTLGVLVVVEPWASTDWSTWTWPNAFRIYDPVAFEVQRFEYEVTGLEPGSYEVMAVLGEADRPATDPIAMGAYPNLLQMGDRPVEVPEVGAAEGIDFELFEVELGGI